MIAADEFGNIVDGDRILGICARALHEEGRLKNDTLVITVMSNLGLKVRMGELGIHISETAVGDRYVMERMLKEGYCLGGEQSGHVIFLDLNTTGDGMLTAIQVLNVLKSSGKSMSQLAADVPIYPQVLVNVLVENERKHEAIADAEMKAAIEGISAQLGSGGRVLVRASGTEPLIRIMLEGQDEAIISRHAIALAKILERRYGGKIKA